jgi:DNA-binding transcriptional LysR family regulator
MLYLTLRQYSYVVAVAETGSLTAAAIVLHVSQPSLSVAITRVEDRLGQQIFLRGKGTAIVITPFGHRLVRQARQLLQLAHDIETGSESETPFVLSCFEDIAPWYLAPALETLKAAFPAMTFRGEEGRFANLISDLAEGRSDLAISYDLGFGGDFKRLKLKDVAPVAFVSADHPFAAARTLELHQLADCQLILSTEDLSMAHMQDLFTQLKLEMQVAHKTTSLEMMRSLAAHGAGVGISYSKPPVDISYDGKPLVTVPITTPQAVAEIVLIWTGLSKTHPQSAEIVDVLASL